MPSGILLGHFSKVYFSAFFSGIFQECAFRHSSRALEIRRFTMLIKFLTAYLLAANLIGFAMMGIDKKRAIRGAWRISEASLFLTALLGGALGCTIGMQHFHHKTKHWYFKYGMPAICIVQFLSLLLLLQ